MQPQASSTIIVTADELIIIQEIRERKSYQREQERIIEQIVNDGNNRLLELNYAIEAAKRELREKKAKLYELSKDQFQAEEDLKQLREDIDAELSRASSILPSFGV